MASDGKYGVPRSNLGFQYCSLLADGLYGRWLRFFRFLDFEVGTSDGTIADVFIILWKKRKAILSFMIAFGVVGFFIARLQMPKYVASMEIIPNTDTQMGGSGGLSGLGGLADIATGGLMKPEQVTLFQQFLAVMETKPVAEEMEKHGHFIAKFYPQRWDSVHDVWKPKSETWLSWIKSTVRYILRIPTPPHPDADDLVGIIKRRVEIDESKKLSIYTLTFASADPQFAKQFLNALYHSTESVLLKRDRAAALMRVRAAEKELSTTTMDASRQALMRTLVTLHLRAIETEVGSPYAAKILSGPTEADFPTRPSVLFYTLGGALAGGLLAVIFFVVQILRSVEVDGRIPEHEEQLRRRINT